MFTLLCEIGRLGRLRRPIPNLERFRVVRFGIRCLGRNQMSGTESDVWDGIRCLGRNQMSGTESDTRLGRVTCPIWRDRTSEIPTSQTCDLKSDV